MLQTKSGCTLTMMTIWRIQPSTAIVKDPSLVDKVDGKVTTLAAFRRSEEAERPWKRLMKSITWFVALAPSFIKRTAKKETITLPDGKTEQREFLEFANGQRFHFPARIPQAPEPRFR